MSVENDLKKYIYATNILPTNVSFEIRPEYFDDLHPQVYILREKNGKFQIRIRIISDRYNAINIEEKVCLILEAHLSEYFYPKVYKKHKNIPGIGDILFTEYKEGASLDKCISELSEIEYSIIVNQLCQHLKKMHSIKSSIFFDFGELKSNNWFAFFECKLKKYLKNALDNRILGKSEIECIIQLLYKDQNYFRLDNASLIHFDVKPANIIWNSKNRKTFLIDFEMSRYGDILMEFTKGKFTAVLSDNLIYENKIWMPLVEQYFSQPYTITFSSKRAIWYLFYHYLAHYNYQLACFGTVSPCVFNEFLHYKEKLLA